MPILYIFQQMHSQCPLFEIQSMQDQQNILFTILHFNDCYDIQPNSKGNFGVVSFEAHLRRLRKKYPRTILLFSGDCFSPSILTNIFEGKQMVEALNMLGIDVACYGNHEFDLDSSTTLQLAQSCNFPWLLGNIKYKGTEFTLGNGKLYEIKEVFGLKLGIFGVAGEDWIGILKSEEYENELTHQDVGEHSKKMCRYLRQEMKCDMVIALTHMREYEDVKLPLQEQGIDLILGGHDHIVLKKFINEIPVLKCGDNFKNLGVIKIYRKGKISQPMFKGRNFDFDITIEDVPTETVDINVDLHKHVEACMEKYRKTDDIIGYTDTQLEVRDVITRCKETNYGNFLADLARVYFDTDCAALGSGSIRNNTVIPPGELRYSTLSSIFNGMLVVKEVPGKVLLEMLEYSLSVLPGISGSFLMISGISLTYDVRKSPRIQEVFVIGVPLEINRIYKLTTTLYLAGGGDGYEMLKPCKMIIDQIAGIDRLTLILKFFKILVKYQEYADEIIQQKKSEEEELAHLQLTRRLSTRTNRIFRFRHKIIINELGKFVCISPKVDGRIKNVEEA